MTGRVGFIGLGEMGKPMIGRILSAGYDVMVFDVVPESVEEVKKAGAKAKGSPKEVAESSEITITMVRDTAQSEEVIFGNNGVMDGAKPGSGIIIMSSVNPDFCRKVAREGAAKGIEVLDAAVSGARIGAESGNLAIMAGGDRDVLEKYRPILETMGNIVYCGEAGTGQVVKLANNISLYVSLLASQEAIAFATRQGVSEEVILEALKKGTGNNWVIQNWQFTNPAGRVGPVHWGIPRKDLNLAIEIASQIGHPVPVTKRVFEILGDLLEQGS